MQTLKVMAGLARHASRDSTYRRTIRQFFAGVQPSRDQIDEWVRRRFAYQPELFEIVRSPQFILNEILSQAWFSGDCDDAATFIASILILYDYPAKFVAIRYQHPTEFEHVFVVSDSYVLDPTVPEGTVYTALEEMVESL